MGLMKANVLDAHRLSLSANAIAVESERMVASPQTVIIVRRCAVWIDKRPPVFGRRPSGS